MSWKAPLVVLWAVLIAGTTVASENQRLCEMNAHSDGKTIADFDKYLEAHEELIRSHEFEVLIVEEVSETN